MPYVPGQLNDQAQFSVFCCHMIMGQSASVQSLIVNVNLDALYCFILFCFFSFFVISIYFGYFWHCQTFTVAMIWIAALLISVKCPTVQTSSSFCYVHASIIY